MFSFRIWLTDTFSYLRNVGPPLLIEQVTAKMAFVNFLCFLDLLFCYNFAHHPFLQNVLQTEETSRREFSSSAFEVRVYVSGVGRVLHMMSHLQQSKSAVKHVMHPPPLCRNPAEICWLSTFVDGPSECDLQLRSTPEVLLLSQRESGRYCRRARALSASFSSKFSSFFLSNHKTKAFHAFGKPSRKTRQIDPYFSLFYVKSQQFYSPVNHCAFTHLWQKWMKMILFLPCRNRCKARCCPHPRLLLKPCWFVTSLVRVFVTIETASFPSTDRSDFLNIKYLSSRLFYSFRQNCSIIQVSTFSTSQNPCASPESAVSTRQWVKPSQTCWR